MAIHIDVIAQMNERATEDVARGLEQRFGEAGEASGEAFSRHLGQAFGGLDKDAQSALDRVVKQADMAGAAIGAALISGTSAAAIGLEKIGDTFETINRGIMATTAASGAALDELKSHADALVGSLDTSAEALGSTMGTLATRLRMSAGTELDTLTKHVTELSDRMGTINVGNLGAGFVQFRVGAAQADDTLASLLQTSREYAVGLPSLVDNLASFGVVLNGVHLNMEQSAHMMGEMTRAGVPLQQGLMGLEVAAQAWSKPEIGRGRDYATFIRDAAESMEYYDRIGNQVARDDIAVKVFGQRRWEQAEQGAQAFLDTLRQAPDAFKAPAEGIDKFAEGTRTLENAWREFRNQMDVALQGPATHFVDELTDKLKEFGEWCNTHQQDLANLFTAASQVAGTVIDALMNITELLGKHPGLIQAAAGAFVAWETIKGVEALTTGLRTISALLTGLPAESAAAGAGMEAGLAPAIAAMTTLASFLALFNMHGSGADPNIGPSGDDRQKRLDAGKSYADSHGGQVPPGYAQWLDKGGTPPPGITMPGAAPGTPFFDPQGRPLNAQGQPFGAGGPGAPYVPGSKSFAPGAPGAPEPPAPPTVPGGVPGGLITPDEFDPKKKGAKGHLPQAPEVPYGASYGAPPEVGETEQHYAARQRLLEVQHKIAEDQARITQLEQSNTATAEDIQKAKNKLLEDQRTEYEAEGRLQETETKNIRKHSGDLEQLGAKIDNDFGISKGLPGIAENLTKFLANLAMAPVMGALQGAKNTLGGDTHGAAGLIGAAALAAGMGGPSGATGGGPGGWTGSSFSGPAAAGLGARVSGAAAANLGNAGAVPTGMPGGAPGGPGGFLGDIAAGGGPAAAAGLSGNQAIMYNAMISQGFSPDQWPALKNLEQHEAGFNPLAANPSGAYGMGQFMPYTWGAYGTSAKTSDPNLQAQDMMKYIKGRYGTPGAAWGQYFNHPGGEGSYADGGALPNSGGGIPIMAHQNEHVLTSSDVDAMGGQSNVYAFRESLHPQAGATAPPKPPDPPQAPQFAAPAAPRPGNPQPLGGPQPGPSMIGGMAPSAGYGSGFQITGGGLVGVAESLPATAISMGMAAAAAALYGGAIEDLAHYDNGGAVPATAAGAGGSPGGAGGGGSPGSSSIGALIGIGMQEINEAVSKGGQAAGALVGGVQQTFGLQQFAQSKQAQSGWVSKLVGGITGAQPQLPNTAGPKGGTPGLTPEQAASQQGGVGAVSSAVTNYGDGANHGVIIENYNTTQDEDSVGAGLHRGYQAAVNAQTGSR